MKIIYKPKTKLEKFGVKIFNLLVENFPQTYFVGGVVRDALLKRKTSDVDLATSATPNQVAEILKKSGITCDLQYQNLGIAIGVHNGINLSISTFRTEEYRDTRYPKITLGTNIKEDAKRRDFTINALYLSPNTGDSSDFHNGFLDIKKGLVRFIGKPNVRIKEDPLRIIRALRFALVLNFKLESKTKSAIKNNFYLLENLTKTKIEKEILKIKNMKQKNILKKVINNSVFIDKYFK